MQNIRRLNLEEARKIFIEEIISKDFYWRINRMNTFLDLIKSHGYSYLSKPSPEKKFELINYCIKAIIVQSLPKIDISKMAIEDIFDSIEKEGLLENYDLTISKLELENSQKLLVDELNYLKVYQDIVDTDFPLENIEEILRILVNS